MEHDEPHMLHVAPGKTGEMGWQFTKSGEFLYGCLIPGHYEAGMVGKVIVVADGSASASSSPAATPYSATPAAASFVEAEVRKVDKVAGKVTLRHAPIANLDMPAMTMIFRANNPAVLDTLKEGDRIRFKAEKILGAYTLLEVAPR